MNRPFCCPEPRCRPIHQCKDSNWQDISKCQGGQSFFCFGKLAKPVTFIYDGVEHVNDLSSCCFTPLKGVVRFQENRQDWQGIITAYTRALEKLDSPPPQVNCEDCDRNTQENCHRSNPDHDCPLFKPIPLRRMKANPHCPASRHGQEHEEDLLCRVGQSIGHACEPVDAHTMTPEVEKRLTEINLDGWRIVKLQGGYLQMRQEDANGVVCDEETLTFPADFLMQFCKAVVACNQSSTARPEFTASVLNTKD